MITIYQIIFGGFRRIGATSTLLVGVLGCKATADSPSVTPNRPVTATAVATPFDAARMSEADQAIEAAVAKGECPGAVLLVGRGGRTGGRVLYQKAYGNRATKPEPESMTVDTIFDLASLSKPVGCATSMMKLIEQGRVRPEEKVAAYLPEFGTNGKEEITVAHLLLHQGGLIPDNALADYKSGPDDAWRKICDLKPQAAPGSTFKYTDVGFIVLGKLVERVGGRPLGEFARDEVFRPAGMTRTAYLPPADWQPLVAPTEQREGRWMRGEVHDPRAHLLGGVAGHAGLFGTAADLSRYSRMLLDGGTIDGTRVLKLETVAEMTKARGLPDGKKRRTYGFDVDTSYSRPRGDRFERGTTFGHTGFTGTSLWVDPVNDCYVILLTNSVHPDGKGKVLALRHKVGTVSAEALLGPDPATRPTTEPVAKVDPPPLAASQARAASPPDAALVVPVYTSASTAAQPANPVSTGLDVLVEGHFKPLHGKRVALVTNHSGLDRDGRRILDLLVANKDVKLVKVFSPEHGLYGMLDEKVSDTTDPKTGLKVYSLYGAVRKPTAEMMAGVDALVFDIQDAGARYYTYISTMGGCMESCAANKVTMFVLDRPNPLTGTLTDGPIADEKGLNFTAYAPMPVSHGMTVGELARMFNAERKINCDLQVIGMKNWRRAMWFDETNLLWVNPSPNLRNPTAALLYLGVGQIEFANVSVGRGTDQPFELLGAPWVDGRKLAAALNAENLPGLRFTPIRFTPASSKHQGKACNGVYVAVTDRSAVQPVKFGIALAWHLRTLHGETFEFAKVNALLKSERTMEAIKAAKAPAEVWATWEADLQAWRAVREKYLIYK